MSQAGTLSPEGGSTGVVETLTGNDGVVVPPTLGNINVIGAAVTNNTNVGYPVYVVGNIGTSTETIQVQVAAAISSADITKAGLAAFNNTQFTVDASNGFVSAIGGGTAITNYTAIAFGDSPYSVLSTDQYISCDTSGGAIIIKFPNAATLKKTYIVKDRTGNASFNNIKLQSVSGLVNFDGGTSLIMAGNWDSVQLVGNGTSYEAY
jgi:hypothetical protein